MSAKNCITHHNACDCREALFAKLEDKNKKLKEALEALLREPVEVSENGLGSRKFMFRTDKNKLDYAKAAIAETED